MMMLALRGGQVITQTFTANATWIAPSTTTSLATLVGKGASGSPAASGTNYWMDRYGYRVHNYANGGTNVGSGSLVQSNQSYQGAPVPGGYCDPLVQGSDGTNGVTVNGVYYPVVSYQDCYYYQARTQNYNNPATTGASASAFGKTFPGGVGGPATPVAYNNVAITPNSSYSIVVPSGGSITITYTK